MYLDNEEWCKMWGGIQLPFQNWREDFEEFWREHSKDSKLLLFNGLLMNKGYNVWAKKIRRSYFSWHWKTNVKFEEKLTCGLENDMRNRKTSTRALESQNWKFYVILLPKVNILWAENLRRSYVSWHWEKMQNFKRNLLVISKLTWGIWRSTQTKYKMSEPKENRGIIFDGTRNWCKLWRKIDLCFPKWHEEFGKFSNWKIMISFSEIIWWNQMKIKVQTSWMNEMQWENFILPWKEINSTFIKTFYTCCTESLFLRYKRISKKAVKIGNFLQWWVHIFLGHDDCLSKINLRI